jgi:hypothetical protein
MKSHEHGYIAVVPSPQRYCFTLGAHGSCLDWEFHSDTFIYGAAFEVTRRYDGSRTCNPDVRSISF